MAIEWGYFDKFEEAYNKYLPSMGEGETMATQICTAVTKLIYKWYNDGDVFDNTYRLKGWANDLSCYANWLCKYADAYRLLGGIVECYNGSDYEDMLKEVADDFLDMEYLGRMNKKPAQGTIYKCDGVFKFGERMDEDDW